MWDSTDWFGCILQGTEETEREIPVENDMPGYNEEFLKFPREFATLHALYPSADHAVNQEHMKNLNLGGGNDITQVQGDNKVAWCNIQQAGELLKLGGDDNSEYAKDVSLLVMRVTYQQSGDAFPVYYLPWKLNGGYRMKLKPSRKHPTQDKGKSIEPAVFITAALQGCSIIVSGEREEPVVYHLNANSAKGPRGETVYTDSDHEFEVAAQAKRDLMLERYNQARTAKPKEGQRFDGARPGQTFPSAGAHLSEYMPDMKPSAFNALGAKFSHGTLSASVGQLGTVFGIRSDDGKWDFYRQTRTRVFIPGAWDAKAGKFDDKIFWLDPVCARFWP